MSAPARGGSASGGNRGPRNFWLLLVTKVAPAEGKKMFAYIN